MGTLLSRERIERGKLLERAEPCLKILEHIWMQGTTIGPDPAKDIAETLSWLGNYYVERAKAVMLLLYSGFDWDAEILTRTNYECFAKIAALAMALPAEQATMLNEFWNVLPVSADKRRARKAAHSESVFPEGHPSRDVLAAIQTEQFMRTGKAAPRAERKRIESKWSFSELIEKAR